MKMNWKHSVLAISLLAVAACSKKNSDDGGDGQDRGFTVQELQWPAAAEGNVLGNQEQALQMAQQQGKMTGQIGMAMVDKNTRSGLIKRVGNQSGMQLELAKAAFEASATQDMWQLIDDNNPLNMSNPNSRIPQQCQPKTTRGNMQVDADMDGIIDDWAAEGACDVSQEGNSLDASYALDVFDKETSGSSAIFGGFRLGLNHFKLNASGQKGEKIFVTAAGRVDLDRNSSTNAYAALIEAEMKMRTQGIKNGTQKGDVDLGVGYYLKLNLQPGNGNANQRGVLGFEGFFKASLQGEGLKQGGFALAAAAPAPAARFVLGVKGNMLAYDNQLCANRNALFTSGDLTIRDGSNTIKVVYKDCEGSVQLNGKPVQPTPPGRGPRG